MKLSDIQRRLQAPFSASLVTWTATMYNSERTRVLLTPEIKARVVQDRLDAVCPDTWAFNLRFIDAPGPVLLGTVSILGSLTVLGITREGVGTGSSLPAAASDALVQCAQQFGIGRYLYDLPKQWADWDDQKREPIATPTLPEWARPDFERSPGAAHILQAMDQLRAELPNDHGLQREVYQHLKAALIAAEAFK